MMQQDELKVSSGEAGSDAASPASPAPQAGEAEAPVGPAPEGSAAEPVTEPAEEAAPATFDHDLDELIAKAQQADEYLQMAQRARADFENYRKRAAREAAAAQDRGAAKLAKELLPAIDNLERALAAADSADEQLSSGIRLVHTDVISALQRAGIEPYSPQGERFDPAHHEAVAQQPVEGHEPGTVVEVYQRGYRLGESVLRPARVLVAG